MDVRLLGPVRVVSQASELVAPASAAQRRLVALLGLRARHVVPAETICAALDVTSGAVRTTVSRVRRLIGSSVLVTEPPGYLLRATTDVDRFEQLIGSARTASAPEAISLRAEALEVFGWEALPEFATEEWAAGAVTRLNELRADTVEELAAGLIDVGRRADAIATLDRHVAAYPYRARPRELQMIALALESRQPEALREFQTYRRFLIEESGTEPPASVRAVEAAIATDRLGPHSSGRGWSADGAKATAVDASTTTESERNISASPDSTPNNLPVHPTSFIGRADELGALAALLADHRLVTVTGSGGAGKTRIASRVAQDQFARFPDGAWWFELAPLADSTVVGRLVADVLQVRVADDESISAAIARRLGNDVCLLVLDNAEHVTAGVAALASDLVQRCPNVVVLATSRRVLGIAGEHAWRLPSLSVPDAMATTDGDQPSDSMRLFAERAHGAGAPLALSDDDRPVVAEICRRLDGVPLAIELAAARTRVMAPRQILDGLRDALGLLTRSGRSAIPRHRTLEASITWSMSLLTDQERALLARLSVFVGSFDVEAVAAICVGDDPAAATGALDVIEALVDHSLVTPIGGTDVRRLSLLEVVRQYGAQVLDAAGELATTRARHARYFAGLARRFGPLTETGDELAAVGRLEADAGNIDAALAWVRESGDEDELVALTADLAPFWNMTSATTDSERWISLALDASPLAPAAARAKLLTYRALARSNVGDYAGSFDDCTAALELAAPASDAWSIGRARWIISDMATWGNLESWRALHDQAIAALATSGDAFAEAYAWLWRAMPYLMRGHLTIGAEALRTAHGKVARLDSPTVTASHLAWHAWARFHAGEFERTEELAREALAGPGFRLASQRFFVEMLSIGAAIRRGVENPPLRDEFERRTALARRQGEILAAASSRQYLVEWLLFSDPAAALDAALRFLAELPAGYKVGECESNLTAAWACLAMDDAEGARRHATAASAVGSVTRWPIVRTRMLSVESMIATTRADLASATAFADDAVRLAADEGLRISLVDALDVRAIAAAADGDFGRVARITGAVTILRSRMGYVEAFVPLSAPTATARQRAASALGGDEFDRQRELGASLAPRDLIEPVGPTVGDARPPARPRTW